MQDLSSDIIGRILEFIPKHDRQEAALSIFQVAPAHRAACLKALQNSLTITSRTPADKFEVIYELALNELEQLDASYQKCLASKSRFLPGHDRALLGRLHTKYLLFLLENSERLGSLGCMSNMLPNVTHLSSLRSLTISVAQTPQMIQGMYEALSELDLHSLTIQCSTIHRPPLETLVPSFEGLPDSTFSGTHQGHTSGVCGTVDYLHNKISDNGSICPHLTALDISCTSAESHPILFNIIHSFPALRDITVHSAVENIDRLRLRHLPNIHIDLTFPFKGSPFLRRKLGSLKCFQELGVDVKSFVSDLQFQDLTPLDGFTQLERLEIPLLGDEILELHHIMLLKTMKLTWVKRLVRLTVNWTTEGEYIPITRPMLRNVIRSNPNLIHLSLCNVSLSSDVFEDIMRMRGGQLQSFGTCISMQRENAVDRLIFVLQQVRRYCTVLNTLEIGDERSIVDHFGKLLPQAAKLGPEIRMLNRRLPKLDLTSAENCARAMLKMRSAELF